jgi:quinol monooxygenase YgiN
MKTLKPAALLIAFLVTFLLTGWHKAETGSNTGINEHVVVVLKFKAQPDKGAMAVSELMKLLEKVKQEPHFVSIRLHIDPNDNTNIMLYEEWEDLQYYNTIHMETEHLKAFQVNSRNFLTGPPDISYWKVEKVFN